MLLLIGLIRSLIISSKRRVAKIKEQLDEKMRIWSCKAKNTANDLIMILILTVIGWAVVATVWKTVEIVF
jgi:hypothetical protein